jgi:hypothetical protein
MREAVSHSLNSLTFYISTINSGHVFKLPHFSQLYAYLLRGPNGGELLAVFDAYHKREC